MVHSHLSSLDLRKCQELLPLSDDDQCSPDYQNLATVVFNCDLLHHPYQTVVYHFAAAAWSPASLFLQL